MSPWDRRRVALSALLTVVALVLALALAGAARGIALYGYVLLLVGLTVASLGARMSKRWQATPAFDRLLPGRAGPAHRVEQLEGLVNLLAGGHPNDGDLHHRLRPFVAEIAGARVAASSGLDLERHAERAQKLVGPRTWELIRPDRKPPADRFAYSWTARDVEGLVGELEAL